MESSRLPRRVQAAHLGPRNSARLVADAVTRQGLAPASSAATTPAPAEALLGRHLRKRVVGRVLAKAGRRRGKAQVVCAVCQFTEMQKDAGDEDGGEVDVDDNRHVPVGPIEQHDLRKQVGQYTWGHSASKRK